MRSAGDQLTLLPATASSCSREDSLTCQAQSGCRMWPAADNIVGTFNQKNNIESNQIDMLIDKVKGKWVLYNFILQNYYVQYFPTDDRWSKPKDILPSYLDIYLSTPAARFILHFWCWAPVYTSWPHLDLELQMCAVCPCHGSCSEMS